MVLMPAPTASITLRLMPSRSSRLMPGLRGTPAVTMMTSAPAIAVVGAGARRAWRRSPRPGRTSARSSALPCGTPSTMSNSTTSPSSLSAARWASVPPIWPAPINAIFFRAMEFSRFRDVAAVDGAARQNRAVYRANAPGRSSLTFGADARSWVRITPRCDPGLAISMVCMRELSRCGFIASRNRRL